MKLAVMQPYLFPYIGYFQLIWAVDKFILLDDVNYINKGWINRNRIIVNGKEYRFTVPLKEASQNKLIKDIEISWEGKWGGKFLKTLGMAYKKAPFFDDVFPIISKIITSEEKLLGKYIYNSLSIINKYLSIKTPIIESSSANNNKNLKGQDRILDICINQKATDYINASGGAELYSEEIFSKHNMNLYFHKPNEIRYSQFSEEFIPWLSIIDVTMFNAPEQIKKMLNQYELI